MTSWVLVGDGPIRCRECGRIIAEVVKGQLVVKCHHSDCKTFNALLPLENQDIHRGDLTPAKM